MSIPEDFAKEMKLIAAAAAAATKPGYGVIVIVVHEHYLSSVANMDEDSVIKIVSSYLEGEVNKEHIHRENFVPRHGRN